MPFAAVGFDLLTALLDSWSVWSDVAGGRDLGMRWHGASQERLRGKAYRPFEDVVSTRKYPGTGSHVRVAPEGGLAAMGTLGLLGPRGEPVLEKLDRTTRFIVTNCSRRLGTLAASRAGRFDLVMTAEEAGAYKPDPRPYRAALDRLGLDPSEVLFVAGSAHDVGGAARLGMPVYWANRGGAPAPADARADREEPDFRALLEVVGA